MIDSFTELIIGLSADDVRVGRSSTIRRQRGANSADSLTWRQISNSSDCKPPTNLLALIASRNRIDVASRATGVGQVYRWKQGSPLHYKFP